MMEIVSLAFWIVIWMMLIPVLVLAFVTIIGWVCDKFFGH